MKAAAVLMFAQTATESQFYGYFCTIKDFFWFLVMIVNSMQIGTSARLLAIPFFKIYIYFLMLLMFNFFPHEMKQTGCKSSESFTSQLKQSVGGTHYG